MYSYLVFSEKVLKLEKKLLPLKVNNRYFGKTCMMSIETFLSKVLSVLSRSFKHGNSNLKGNITNF